MATERTSKNDATALLITFTDQENWGLNGKRNRLDLNCNTDIDANWRLCFGRYFKKLICYDIFKQANSNGIIEANKELLLIARNYRPEYVIYTSGPTGIVTFETLLAIRGLGCRIVGYFCDDDVWYDTFSKFMIPYMDYCVTITNPDMVERYEKDGGKAFFAAPIPTASDIFSRFEDSAKWYDISFVGNHHVADRQLWVEKLLKAGMDLKLFGGSGDKKIHFSRYVEIINRSRINLHFSKHALHGGELVPQLKGRVFEVTLCGGFLLCEYLPLVERFFEIDKEIVCFKTPEEAVAKINYYLRHDEEREAIARNGYIRANRDYEGLKVIEKLFAEIESGKQRNVPVSISKDITPLHVKFSNVYGLWADALLKSAYPLRAQWKECAELALRTNPGNRRIKRLLLTSKLFGDAQPVRGLYKKMCWEIATLVNNEYILLRKKLRFVKKMLKK